MKIEIDTLKRLKKYFRDERFRFNFIYIGTAANLDSYDYLLERKNGKYEFYSTDRGKRYKLNEFDNEKDACEFVYNELKDNLYGKSHCITSTYSEERAKRLGQKLENENIKYHLGKSMHKKGWRYLVVVHGKDVRKAKFIKWFGRLK